MPVAAHHARAARVVQENKFTRKFVLIGRHFFAENAEARVAVSFLDVAEDLIVRAIFFDDVNDVLDEAGLAERGDPPFGPGGRQELHRAEGTGAGRAGVGAVAALDLADGREHLPRQAAAVHGGGFLEQLDVAGRPAGRDLAGIQGWLSSNLPFSIFNSQFAMIAVIPDQIAN